MDNVHIREYDQALCQQLITEGIPPLMARLYVARGVKSVKEIDHTFASLLPFHLLKNCEAMAKRLAYAIENHELILVVADYDADGATACAVAMEGLTKLGAQVGFIVPNRFKYGYGLTPQIAELAAIQKPQLILTVDNGISSIEGVERANSLGIEVLVTDHHLPTDSLPKALIVNPNQVGCNFPSKNLAGVGVIFYVLLALRAYMRSLGKFIQNPEPNMVALLDWVAIGTISDVAKLDQNNRILVEQGLRQIRLGRMHEGTKALFKIAKKDPTQASASDLGYAIGPRLNAAGRMDDMAIGIHCLMEKESRIALDLARQLDAFNSQRRRTENTMQEEALKTIYHLGMLDSYTLTLYHKNWHQGVIGVLASRIKDRFYRPVIVFALSEEGELCGSARSMPGFHLRNALDLVNQLHPGLMSRFGGHEMAAGLSIPYELLADFTKAFESIAKKKLNAKILTKCYETDGHLSNAEMTFHMAQQLNQPVWGRGFEAPIFCDEFAVISQQIIAEKHLKLLLKKNAENFEAMLFNTKNRLPDDIAAVYQIVPNTWRDQQNMQIYIKHWATRT